MKLRILIIALVVAVAGLAVHAGISTNKTYYFDNSTGDIITNLNIYASPALFSITNGHFFDAASGNYCSLVSTTVPTSYQTCTNFVWDPGTGVQTNVICSTLSSNITVLGRYLVGASNFYNYVTNTISYQVCTNIIYTGPPALTNRTCFVLSSNFIATLTSRYYGAFPVTNKAAAVKTGP